MDADEQVLGTDEAWRRREIYRNLKRSRAERQAKRVKLAFLIVLAGGGTALLAIQLTAYDPNPIGVGAGMGLIVPLVAELIARRGGVSL